MENWWEQSTWTSQDGRVWYPEQGTMELSHMRNCISMIERNMDTYHVRYSRPGQRREEFEQMIRTSRIYTILQACIARGGGPSHPKQWGIRGGK